MMSGAHACQFIGGCAASLRGEPVADIRRLPLAVSQQSKATEFSEHFGWAVDDTVATDSRARGNVSVGLDAAAQAFRTLPAAEAERWSLQKMYAMADADRALPHVYMCPNRCPAFALPSHRSPGPCLLPIAQSISPTGQAHARLQAPRLRRRDGAARLRRSAGDALLEEGWRTDEATWQGGESLR